ncbi:MAG: hypothetical protein KGH88_03975 [Thaumarchaeota archaeon]|nr:hypothetical protein [Nitrososphaerota archaeon]
MNKAMYYIGIGIASAAFLSLIFIEMKYHAAPGVVGGLIAAVIAGGCILMAFSDGIKKADKMNKTS